MKNLMKIIGYIIGFIIVGMSIQWGMAFILVGYQKATEWLFGDWNLITNQIFYSNQLFHLMC